MKEKIDKQRLDNSIFLLQPTRPVFCTTKNADGSDHAAPFSWIIPISCKPPRVAFALQNYRGRKQSQSLLNIIREGEFAINMPCAGQEKTLVQSSFNLVHHKSKLERTGFTPADAACIKPKLIEECPASLECRVISTIDIGGDHTLILADIVSASCDPALYDDNLCPNVPDMMPLINLKEKRFDDHQQHWFLDGSHMYDVDVYYEKPEPPAT